MIELKNVTLVKKKSVLADHINLKLNNGKIYGICVSEPLLTLFAGLLSGTRLPVSGTVIINGFDTSRELKKVKSFLSYVPNGDVLYDRMTPLEYLLFIADAHGTEYQKAIRKIADALDFTELSMKRNMLIKNLSFYEKKRLLLAQSLLSGGDIFILNSPLEGLTSTEKEHFKSILEDALEGYTAIILDTTQSDLFSLCEAVYTFCDNGFTLIEANDDGKEEND